MLAEEPYCQIGGRKCTGVSTTVDHRVPLSVRPDLAHERSNLRGACAACNYAGGARITNAKANGYRPVQPGVTCSCRGYCIPADAGLPRPPDCYGTTAVRM